MKNCQFLQRICVVTHLWYTLTKKKLLSSQPEIATRWKHNLTTKSCETYCSPASLAVTFSPLRSLGAKDVPGPMKGWLNQIREENALPIVKSVLSVTKLYGNPLPIILNPRLIRHKCKNISPTIYYLHVWGFSKFINGGTRCLLNPLISELFHRQWRGWPASNIKYIITISSLS